MNPSTVILSVLLSAFSISACGEEIKLLCRAPGKTDEGKVIIDTEQMAVRYKGRPGNIGLITRDNIYYYLKFDGRLVSYRLNLTDGVIDVAASKSPPAVGYDHGKQICRRA